MSDSKPTRIQIKALQKQIEKDQAQPPKPAEKRLKVKQSFNKAVQTIVRASPKK
jgi:hypothetical protein